MRRARIGRLTPAVLTVFLAGGVLPRAVVVVHRHDGAGWAHVHVSDGEFSARSRVQIRRGSPGVRDAGLWARGDGGWHAHAQDPFQQGAILDVERVSRADAVLPVRLVSSGSAR